MWNRVSILFSFNLGEEEEEEKEDKNFFKEFFPFFFTLADFIKQLAFAFVSAYDIPWACFGIELFWVLFIFSVMEYNSKSEIVSGVGSSIVVIISTVVSIVCKYKKTGFLSLGASVSLVIIACIPAILSLYAFFGFDFELCGDDDDAEEEEEKSLNKAYSFIAFLIMLMTPWFSLFFGMFIPVIVDHFIDFYSDYHKM